jgi:hypothetical protein
MGQLHYTEAIAGKDDGTGLDLLHLQANGIETIYLEDVSCPCVVAQVSTQARSGAHVNNLPLSGSELHGQAPIGQAAAA